MKYIKTIIFFIITLLVTNLIITLISYFDLLNENTIEILKIVIYSLLYLSTGLYFGLNTKKKAYIESLKLSLIFILFYSLIIIIFPGLYFNIKLILNYLLFTSLLLVGSIIGINIKRLKN